MLPASPWSLGVAGTLQGQGADPGSCSHCCFKGPRVSAWLLFSRRCLALWLGTVWPQTLAPGKATAEAAAGLRRFPCRNPAGFVSEQSRVGVQVPLGLVCGSRDVCDCWWGRETEGRRRSGWTPFPSSLRCAEES